MKADAVSTPVWVVRPTVDLKICMYDCLYQDSIAIQSRWAYNTAHVFIVLFKQALDGEILAICALRLPLPLTDYINLLDSQVLKAYSKL